jgi:hypothetical protein
MSLVDQIFSSIPGPLISQFGISATYVKSQEQEYDPLTGTFRGPIDYATGQPILLNEEIEIKIVPTELNPSEARGNYQEGDGVFLIAASSLGTYYPRITDLIKYFQDGIERTARIVDIVSYRGDAAIMHKVILRVG